MCRLLLSMGLLVTSWTTPIRVFHLARKSWPPQSSLNDFYDAVEVAWGWNSCWMSLLNMFSPKNVMYNSENVSYCLTRFTKIHILNTRSKVARYILPSSHCLRKNPFPCLSFAVPPHKLDCNSWVNLRILCAQCSNEIWCWATAL